MLPAKIACVAILFAVISLSAAKAEVPNLISYQGRLTETDGSPVPDGNYNLTFQIVEHDPLPMGETPLWSSGVQAVTVTDGLFVYYLGSNVPLPASVFTNGGLESHFVRVHIEGSVTFGRGVQFAAVPFAYEAISADTAAYALSGPGSGAVGWVDDGSVVRLQSGGDRVGIGTTSPGENLVVGGGDLGSYEGAYIVSANSEWDDYSGFKLGWNLDNHATINWHGDGDQLRFHLRSMGTSYNDNLVLRAGYVGIGVGYPLEPLVVGVDLGAYYGDFVQMGRLGSGRYSGFMCGEDENNRAAMMWINNSNELRFGYKTGGVDYGNHLTLRDGQMIVTGTGDASVQLPTGAVSSDEVLDEAGLTFLDQAGTWFWLESDPMVLQTVGLTLPGPGYVLITANVNFAANLQSSDSSHAAACVQISRSPNSCDVAEYAAVNQSTNESWCTEWNPPPSKVYGLGFFIRQTLAAQQIFYESSGGTKVYFLNGCGWCVGYCTGRITFKARTSAVYVPTWYGNTAPPALTSLASDLSVGETQPKVATPLPANSDNILNQLVDERVRSESDKIRKDFDRQLQTMREEFQQQLEGLNK